MGQFNLYAAAGSIDASLDKFLIYQNSSGVLKTISRNTVMGVSGTPADLSSTQSFTNKTIGNTNSITVQDTNFTLQDNIDTTKQLQFQLSGISTGTTRTLTVPNVSDTIAVLGAAQTFTGIDQFSQSISVDTINGYTSASTGNIYGIAVTSSVITQAGAVGSVAIAANAVLSGKLGLSSSYTGGVATFSNSGTAGGTGYYVNLGGIKLCWGVTASQSSHNSPAYTIVFPSGFFTTVQSMYVNPVNLSVDVSQITVLNTPTLSASSNSVYFSSITNSSGAAEAACWIAIGT